MQEVVARSVFSATSPSAALSPAVLSTRPLLRTIPPEVVSGSVGEWSRARAFSGSVLCNSGSNPAWCTLSGAVLVEMTVEEFGNVPEGKNGPCWTPPFGSPLKWIETPKRVVEWYLSCLKPNQVH